MPGGLFWLQHLSAGSGLSYAGAVLALAPDAYWRCGESSGDLADSSGNAHTLSATGLAYGVTGWPGDGNKACTWAGSGDYASVADHADWDIGTSDYTISWCHKVDGTPAGSETIIGHSGQGYAGDWAITLTSTSNLLQVNVDNTGYNLFHTASWYDDEWWHCVVTCDRSGDATLWANGVNVGTVDISTEVSSDLTNTQSLWLGAVNTTTQNLNGSLDEVVLWNSRLLVESEITTIYDARSGSQGGAGGGGGGGSPTQADTYAAEVLSIDSGSVDAYYKMDEGSGTVMADSSDTDNDGSYQGSPTLGVTGPFDGTTAAQFDGSTQWAQAPYASALDAGTGDWSCIAWIKRDADDWTNWEWLIARHGEGFDTMELFTGQSSSDELASRFSNVAETDTTIANSSTTTDFAATWHMVGLSADRDGNCEFWLDGASYGTESISSHQHTLSGTNTLYLARRSIAAFGWWDGSMCQVSIWADYLLTSSDVSDLWTAAGN